MSLRLEKVGKRVGGEDHIVDVTLELKPGLNVLLGPTLAGKTSLMRLMAGLDRPTSGRVLVDGTDVTGLSVRQRSVAMVYQQFINYPSFSVFKNIASPLKLAGLSAAEVDAKVRETAGLLHIDGLLDRLPSELSGGQQQRTAIARALVKDASLLLLDEPLVNLDYKLREELRSELRALFRRREAIVVYATTEPLEALIMGGHVVVLGEGRVLQAGPTVEVYHAPASTAVASVFSDPPMNMIDGHVTDGKAMLGREIALSLADQLGKLARGNYRFGVRANHLSLERASEQQVAVPAVVELSEISGSETFVHVRHGDVSWVVQAEGVHSLALGEEIDVFLDPRRVFAFDHAGTLSAAPARAAAA